MKKRRSSEQPVISTASLPDIIFMLLFFFMVVTVLRESSSSLEVYLPSTFHHKKIDLEPQDLYLWVGKSTHDDDTYLCQVNDKVVKLEDFYNVMEKLKQSLTIEARENVQVHLQADKMIPMKYLWKIKLALRKLDLRKVVYHISPTES